jgi:uncharacterized protein (DUF983 family)
MLGYAGGFVGPLIVGWALDYSAACHPRAWAVAFVLVAVIVLAGMVVTFQIIGRMILREIAARLLN